MVGGGVYHARWRRLSWLLIMVVNHDDDDTETLVSVTLDDERRWSPSPMVDAGLRYP